jgi:type IV pilus assembly protein PilY1
MPKVAGFTIIQRIIAGAVAFGIATQPAQAALLSLATQPIYLGAAIPPQVMITMTKDQQLFKKAYNDYSDLDGDGVLETTYKHSINYYGYFDSFKCYDYSTSNNRFEPASLTTDKYCGGNWSGNFLNWVSMTRMDAVRKLLYGGHRSTDTATSTVLQRAYLPTDAHSFAKYYSGTDVNRLTPFNALTTAQTSTSTTTMTLPDVVAITSITRNNPGASRTFTATVTTSIDHSLSTNDQVRIYGVTGTNSGQYNGVKTITVTGTNTFTYTGTTNSSDQPALTAQGIPGYFARRTFVSTVPVGGYPLSLGDQVTIRRNSSNFMVGTIVAVPASDTFTIELSQDATGSGSHSSWTITNHSSTGISFCNATLGGTGTLGTGAPTGNSQGNANPPLLRVARGNHALWGANERWQCYFRDETTAPDKGSNLGDTRTNGNRFSDSGVPSNGYEPQSGVHGLGSVNYVVRVQACASAALAGQEKCREYNTNNAFKPIGLLQVYGEPGLIHFGLISGSFTKNLSGGVLRKNVGTFTNEVAADGTFLVPSGGSIIGTLNSLRIYGYNYGDGTYLGSSGDNCGFQLTSITEGNCKSWGNPMSEMYFESLRYFAGATSPSSAFHTTNDGTLLTGLGAATWPAASTTVLSNSNYCAPLSIVAFNSSVSTNEDDNQIGSLSVVNSTRTAKQLTTTVGDSEPGSGAVRSPNLFFFGKDSTTPNTDAGFELCTEKAAPAGGLGDVIGICPEGPTLGGTFLMTGLAHHAKVNPIRTDITAVPVGDTKSLKVTTYGVNLSTNVPALPLKVTGDTTPRVIIQPAYRLFNSAPQGGGALVDLKIVSQTVGATSNQGSLYLNWEDSEQGGDYDQDMWGTLSWCMQVNGDTASCPQNRISGVPTTNTISITTKTIAESTGNPQGFGYILSGTSKDGPHFHSGIEGFNFAESSANPISVTPATKVNANGGCANCQLTDAATTAVYTLTTAGTAQQLKDPLYLAAKYGGFKDSNANNLPDLASEWDLLDANGNAGADGNPDNYFLVSNPLGLETSLNKVFLTILLTSSASSVATNSTSLQAGTKLYQARFNSNDWSGQVLAFPVSSDGSVSTTPDWDAGVLMNPNLTPSFNPSNRVIITNTKGVAGSAPRGVAFRWPANPASPSTSEITAAMVTALKTNPSTNTVESDTVGSNRLQWLRGVSTNEGVAAGDFRRRQTSKLGDIVNSNPNFVGVPAAGHGDAAYAAFRLLHTVTTPRRPIVYAASNDGMLHGFDASSDATKGQEVIAFMPSKSLLKANKLTSQTYQHEYFVDGSPEVQDVCTTSHLATEVCTGWATYLAGTQGFGGHSVYMLDVTTPSAFTEANAQNIVKWEFTDADDRDLGFSPGTPLIRRMANGKWAVIVSGGYNNSQADGSASSTGYGVIFILFTSGPTGTNGAWTPNVDYIKLTTETGSTGTPNGLAQPFSADINTDGITDFLYAGDLRGNFWKFDLRSTTATNWTSSSSRVVLFQARDASNNLQPITAPAEGSSHVTGTGFMINVGTGKYLENTDIIPPGTGSYLTQSYYGIWDKNDSSTTISVQTTVARSDLLRQEVLANVTTTAGTARVVSSNTPNWTDTSQTLHKGWYLDFPSAGPPSLTPPTGERVVFQPTLINGRLIFTTLVPSTASCSSGGQSFLMVLDNMTGGRFIQSPFDTSGDGTINSSDLVTIPGIGTVAVSGLATGIGSTGGIAGTPTVIKAGTGAGGSVSSGTPQYAGGTAGAVAAMGVSSYWEAYLSLTSATVANVLLDLGSNSLGRLSWREIITD